jgi:threonine dehydratase
MIRRLFEDDVFRAAERIRPHLPPTPQRRSFAAPPGKALLKLECWQPTGSFKVRGATHFLLTLTAEEKRRGIVAASAGNHALGVAFAAGALGGTVVATLFVPETAPRTKVEKLRAFPVTVVEAGATYDDAYAAAVAHSEKTGAVYLHAYDDVRTAAGQGTVGLEILEQCKDVGTIVVPVGGGGLIAGIAACVKASAPSVRIVAVQPEASPSLRESLREGRALTAFPAGETLADGLAGGIGELVFAHRDLVDAVVTVSEEEMADAILALLAADQVVAEASGAASLAAIRAGRIQSDAPVVAVITGANIDGRVLARLVRSRPDL